MVGFFEEDHTYYGDRNLRTDFSQAFFVPKGCTYDDLTHLSLHGPHENDVGGLHYRLGFSVNVFPIEYECEITVHPGDEDLSRIRLCLSQVKEVEKLHKEFDRMFKKSKKGS